MADSPDFSHWVAKAEEDVAVARLLSADASHAFGTIIVFHCQQAAEKYLKACLRKGSIDFPKVHDFERLLRLCEQLSPAFAALGDTAARLQPFAVQARYTLRDAEPETVQQAIRDMNEIREFCRSHLGISA